MVPRPQGRSLAYVGQRPTAWLSVTDRGIPRNDCSIGPQGARRVGHRARFACLLARLRVCPVVADLAHGVGARHAAFVRPAFEHQPPFLPALTYAPSPP